MPKMYGNAKDKESVKINKEVEMSSEYFGSQQNSQGAEELQFDGSKDIDGLDNSEKTPLALNEDDLKPKRNWKKILLCRKGEQAKDEAKVVESNPNARLKQMVRTAVEGKFTTIVMTIVTLFALVGVSQLSFIFPLLCLF